MTPGASLLPDLRQFRLPDPPSPREAADAGERVVGDAGLAVRLRVGLDRRLAAVAEDGVAALDVLHQPLDLLVVELHLPRTLRDGDRFLPARAGQEDVIGERRLHEAAVHRRTGMFRTGGGLAGPVGAGKLAERFDFG